MKNWLYGLLFDLERTCSIIKKQLVEASKKPILNALALETYQEIEIIRREAIALTQDPSLGHPKLIRNQFEQYQGWVQKTELVEIAILPTFERFALPDERLTRLIEHFKTQTNLPIPGILLISTISSQYYWTLGSGVIFAPATAGASLLGMADLAHEIGHVLQTYARDKLVGTFEMVVYGHVRELLAQAIRDQSAKNKAAYLLLFDQWKQSWISEFVADMVAVYLIGPAFGKQHLRLCMGVKKDVFQPTFEPAVHPADEARLQGMILMLEALGDQQSGSELREIWNRFVQVIGEKRPNEFDDCYPEFLLESLVSQVVEGCRELGIVAYFDQPNREEPNLVRIFNDAWDALAASPEQFKAWEQLQLDRIWQELDQSTTGSVFFHPGVGYPTTKQPGHRQPAKLS